MGVDPFGVLRYVKVIKKQSKGDIVLNNFFTWLSLIIKLHFKQFNTNYVQSISVALYGCKYDKIIIKKLSDRLINEI